MAATWVLGTHTARCIGSSPIWGTMKKLIVSYKNFILKVHALKNNTTIFDSYQVKSLQDMKSIIRQIQSDVSGTYAINSRSVSSMVYEWRTHNLLYSLRIERNRTKDVDLNTGQPWYSKVLYFLLSPFYLHFRWKFLLKYLVNSNSLFNFAVSIK